MSQRKTYYVITDMFGRTVAIANKLKKTSAYVNSRQYGSDITIVRYTCDATDGAVVHREVLLDE